MSVAIIQDGLLQYINPECAALIGYSLAECFGKPFLPIVFEADRPLVMAAHQTFSSGAAGPTDYELRLESKAGRVIDCRLNISTVPWGGRNAALATFEDVTAQKAMEAELRRLACIDPLTGLSSQEHFDSHLELALARLKRGADRECTILMISLDYLPAINVALGYQVADAGLRFFSALLRNELRDVDLAGRFDGEKIAVLLPESDQAAAAVFAKRLRNKVAETSINVGDNQLLMTFNIGIAAIRGNDTTGSQALMRANQALIQKKTAADTAQAAPQNSHQGARCNAKPSKMAARANESR